MFLNYINQNMSRLQALLLKAPEESIGTSFPADPYTGQTHYNSTTQTVYRYTGSAWAEEAFLGNRDSLVTSPGTTVVSGTLGLVPWNTTGLDTALMTYSGGTFTVVKAGYYVINANVVYALWGTGANRSALLSHSGVYVSRQSAPEGNVINPGATANYSQYLSVGDTIAAWYYQDSGVNLGIVGGASGSYFGFVRTGG